MYLNKKQLVEMYSTFDSSEVFLTKILSLSEKVHFLPVPNENSENLGFVDQGVNLSSYIQNIPISEKILLFKELAIEALKAEIAVEELKISRLALNFSLDQVYIIPKQNYIYFQYPQLLNQESANKKNHLNSPLNTLRASLYALIDEINLNASSFHPHEFFPRSKNKLIPKSMNELLEKLTYPQIENESSSDLKAFAESIEIKTSKERCVFCLNDTEELNDKIVKLDSQHTTHLKCFSKEMTMPVLEANNQSEIYCRRDKNLNFKHECEYNETGVCSLSCGHNEKPKSYPPVYYCLCHKNKKCKYSVKVVSSINDRACTNCKEICCDEVIPQDFFKRNRELLPFTILRKYQILMLKHQYRRVYHEGCSHVENVPYVDPLKLKPFKFTLKCRHNFCSFCAKSHDNSKGCLAFKEFINKVGLVNHSEFVEEHLIL